MSILLLVKRLSAVSSISLLLAGCATHHAAWESWDQGQLKANDHGCPTAIYIAPNGVLTQCP